MGKRFFKKLGRKINRAAKKINNDVADAANDVDKFAKHNAQKLENAIVKTGNQTEKLANKSVNAVSILMNKLINGPNSFSPSAKETLNKHGDKQITRIEIVRNPIPQGVQGIMDTFGGRIGVDRLMHLAIVWTLADGTRGILEKNEVINIARGPLPVKNGGAKIEVQGPFTNLNEMMVRTKERMGQKQMFHYSVTNNCQVFISNVLQANDLDTADNLRFVVQETDNLFKGKANLRKFSNTVTDIAGRANMLVQGGGLHDELKRGIICRC